MVLLILNFQGTTQNICSLQAVYDEGIPYLEKVLGCHENRVQASPGMFKIFPALAFVGILCIGLKNCHKFSSLLTVYGDFQGLPPLCVCVSQHEVVYDQAMLLAKRAKEQGVDVTIGVWKYSKLQM